MNEKILFVDDDPNILSGYKRKLRKQYKVETALGPEAGLEEIAKNDQYAIVISDFRMPNMNGVEFLTKVKEISPETVRIMLTGQAEQNTAVEAVNEGNIFRFLTKPCPDELMCKSLNAGMEQYRLIMAEKELLEKTLKGSVDILTEILSLFHPDLFGRTMRLRELIQSLASFLKIQTFWDIEIASMLSPIGCVGIPPEIISKIQNEQELNDDEKEMVSLIPEIGAHLLANIPRFKPISRIIFYQNKRFDGSGFPKDSVKGSKIPLGARILKPLSDLLELESTGITRNQAISELEKRSGWYDSNVLEKIKACFWKDFSEDDPESIPIIPIKLEELQVSDILMADIETSDGNLLLSAGQKISPVHIQRLRNYEKLGGIKAPILIRGKIEIKEEVDDK